MPDELEAEIVVEEGVQESVEDITNGILFAEELKKAAFLIMDLHTSATTTAKSSPSWGLSPLHENGKVTGLKCGYGDHILHKDILAELSALFRKKEVIDILANMSLYSNRQMQHGEQLIKVLHEEVLANPLNYQKLFERSAKVLINKR